MNVKVMFMVVFIMIVFGFFDVMLQICDLDVDEYMEVDDVFGVLFLVFEIWYNIGCRQCYQICYDVDICYYVNYDSIYFICEFLELDEGYFNFDEEDCDYYFWVREYLFIN